MDKIIIDGLTGEDICYAKHIIEGPLRIMDCGHERIFYRDILGEGFRCSRCGHFNGLKFKTN